MARLVSLSRTGRHVVLRTPEGLEIVDALGTAPRTHLAGAASDFACVGTMVWVLRGTRIDRHALACGAARPSITLPRPGVALRVDRGDKLHAAVVDGEPPVLALETSVQGIDTADRVFPLAAQRVAWVAGDALRIVELGRREPVVATVRLAGQIVAAHAMYDARLIAVLARRDDGDAWTVLRPDGVRVQHLDVPRATWCVAGDAGIALGVADDGARWYWADLRYGAVRGDGDTPLSTEAVDISADAQHLVFARAGANTPEVVHVRRVDLFAAARAPTVAVVEPVEPAPRPGDAIAVDRRFDTSDALDRPDDAKAVDRDTSAPSPRSTAVLDLVPRALGEPLPRLETAATTWPAYASAREHQDAMLDLVAARAARAIAEAWNTGKLARDGAPLGVQREVEALIGAAGGFAADELAAADVRLADAIASSAGRVRSTLAAGVRLPFVELLRELDLSPIAGHILMIVMAATERAEIARLFELLAGRPAVDRFLVEAVLAGGDRARRAAIADELADGAPLRRYGILHVAGDPALPAFEPIAVDPIVIARLSGRIAPAAPVRALAELHVAPDALRALVDAVAVRRPQPLRLVMRGRRGAGRRSIVAALAARVDRAIADIDCARLPRAGVAMAAALRRELRHAVLRGCVAVVSGLELADATDAEGQDQLRQVLRAHPAALVVRAAPESSLPLDPGFVTVALPPLTETERAAFWRSALVRADLAGADVDALAARWRITPGVIETVIANAHGDAAALDGVARQHVATRLAHIATPVRRLADWHHVALADDMLDSIREFIGRVAQRKTVFEHWGFDAKVASARGLTALFYGPPGTGKSMVAGLIARELGLELFRVDLSRVVSKWLGETEKNLAEVFDAAEDGQVVLLFDEADSLFAKRTDVKTSHDRYANLEVNYLLQRLDSFEGVAILTTNLDGTIDPAFKRRMSMRLQFPFPDEDMRRRLWATHIPAEAPVANDFDFGDLARKFPLSGGYIRNSTLRAAFLAAQERRPLAQEHLVRAIALEYRELGKLATGGRLE